MYYTHVYNRASCRHIPRLYILYVSHTYVAGRVVDYMRELCTIYNAPGPAIAPSQQRPRPPSSKGSFSNFLDGCGEDVALVPGDIRVA